MWLPSGRPSTSRAARAAPEQRLEVDAGLDAHLVQHRDEVLGGDVAGRARAGPGSRRARRSDDSKESHAGLERGEHVGQALAARVVEVGGQLDAVAAALARACRRSSRTWRGLAMPVVSPKPISSRRRREPAGDVEHALGRHVALVGTAEGHRDHALAAQARLARARASTRSSPTSDSSIERLTFLRLCVSDADRKKLISSKALALLQRVVEAALVGDQHRDRRRRRRALDRAPAPRSASASCGITSARTKLVTSSRRRPGARERVDQPHLVGGRDDLRLVLEAVARADLADAHAVGKLGHLIAVHMLAALDRARRDHRRHRRARLRPGAALGPRRRARRSSARATRTAPPRPPSAPRAALPDGQFEGSRTPRPPRRPRSSCSACRSATSPRP